MAGATPSPLTFREADMGDSDPNKHTDLISHLFRYRTLGRTGNLHSSDAFLVLKMISEHPHDPACTAYHARTQG